MAVVLAANDRKAAYRLMLLSLRVLEDTPSPASCFTYKDAATLAEKLTDSLLPPFDTTQLLIVQPKTHEKIPHLLSIIPTTNGSVICEITSTRANEEQQQQANQLKQQLEAHFTRLNMPCRILQRMDTNLPTPSSTEDVSAYHTLRLFQLMLKQQYPAHPLNDFGHTLDELVAFACACKQLANPEQNYSVDSHNNLHISDDPGCLINLPNPNHRGYLLQNHGVVTNAHCEFDQSTEQYNLTYHSKSNDTEDDLSLQATANLLYHEKHERFTGDVTQLPINFWGLDETRAERLTQHLFAAGFALVNGQLNPNRTDTTRPQAAEIQTPDTHIHALETPTPEPATPTQPASPTPRFSRTSETDVLVTSRQIHALQADLDAAREEIAHLSRQLEIVTTALGEARQQHDLLSNENSRLTTINSTLETAASRAAHRIEALEAEQQSRLAEIDALHKRQEVLEATARKAAERASALQDKLSSAQTEVRQLATAGNALKEQLTASTSETETLQQDKSSLEARITTLTSQLALAQAAQRKVEGERDELHTEIDSLRCRHDTLEATARKTSERASTLQDKLSAAKTEIRQLATAGNVLKEQLTASTSETEALQQTKAALEARIEALASQLALAQAAQRKVEGERDALHTEINSLRSKHHTLKAAEAEATERANMLTTKLTTALTKTEALSAELAHSTARVKTAESAVAQMQSAMRAAADRSKADINRLESRLKLASLKIDEFKIKPGTQHASSQAGTPNADLEAERTKLTIALQAAQRHIKSLEQQLEEKADYIPLSHLENEMQRTEETETAHATVRHENDALRREIETLRDTAQEASRAATQAIQTHKAEIKHEAEIELTRTVELIHTKVTHVIKDIQQQHENEIEALKHKIILLEKPTKHKSVATNTSLTDVPEDENPDKLKYALESLKKEHASLLKKLKILQDEAAHLSTDYSSLSTEHSTTLAAKRHHEHRLQKAIERIDDLESMLRESHIENHFKKPTPPGRSATTRRERDLVRKYQTEKAALQAKLEALQERPETKPHVTTMHATVATQAEAPTSVETAMNTERPIYVDASTTTPPRTHTEKRLSGTILTLLANSPASKHHHPDAQNVDHLLQLSPQGLVIHDSKLSAAIPLTQGLLMGLKVAFKEDGEKGDHRNHIGKMMHAINTVLVSNKLINPESIAIPNQSHFFKPKADTKLLKKQAHQLATALIQHTDKITASDVIKSALDQIKLPHKSYCPTIGDHLDDAIGYLMAFGHEPKTQALLASDLLAMTLHGDTPQRKPYRLHFSADDATEETPALASPLTATV